MGRNSTGAITTGSALRLELSYLLKQGIIPKQGIRTGYLSWTNGSEMYYEIENTSQNQYIRLKYSNTNYSGEVNDLDYKIQLDSIPSNLGRGRIWYFVCPFTGRKARILYKCYGSLYFKSMKAYQRRIYYSSQISSKLNFNNDRYFDLEKQLEKLRPKKKSYQGKETRIWKRIRRLEAQLDYHDFLRWDIMPKSVLKYMGGMGISAKDYMGRI
jgi:hypothetical protein